MKIENLSNDIKFLNGLKNGEFCLILGAGFSYGLKNVTNESSLSNSSIDYGDYKFIPLVNAFINITNKIFLSNVNKGESAANVWKINNFSYESNNQKVDLKDFYKNLFTLDKEWFKKEKFESFKNILIPNWYQIYTLNFDDVFENILDLSGNTSFYSLHYPEHTGILKTNDKAIIHLHGFINRTSPEKITFSDDTYTKLSKDDHTLYDQLYTDVNFGKKLVIIGTQFDEKVIDNRFFDGLHEKDIAIYHFDLTNQNFQTKPGIFNNENYKFIEIKSTRDVLDFLESNKEKIENISIEGVTLINTEFIEKILKNGKTHSYSNFDFYLAKQTEECQWFGVINNWAVFRKNHKNILNEIKSSFLDSNRRMKVSAVITGKGGSGKSTLLRQLSLELCSDGFSVLWVQDKDILSFYTNGLMKIKEFYSHKMFLIIIEDLYRINQQDIDVEGIIDDICQYENIRIVIGDRNKNNECYKKHVYNPSETTYELTPKDNKAIIKELLKKIPEWKDTVNYLFTSDDCFKSTLYFILWTIGRTFKLENTNKVRHGDVISHFRELVENDLKILAIDYDGVAKMLYYWSCIYSKYKFFITYDVFFKLADFFKLESSNESNLIEMSPMYKAILDIYTHESLFYSHDIGEINLFSFNHDILVEEGLCFSKLKDWNEFDDTIKYKMLTFFLKEYNSINGCPSFVSHCILTISEKVISIDDKKKILNDLFNKGIYLAIIFNKTMYSTEERLYFSAKILEKLFFWEVPDDIVRVALQISNNKIKAKEILEQDKFWNLPPKTVSIALQITNNKEKAEELLSQDKFWNFHFDIVFKALQITNNKEKAEELLSQDKFWNFHFDIVIKALQITNNREKAEEILAQDKFWNFSHVLVCSALQITNNKEKAEELLSQDKFWNFHFDIVFKALQITNNKEKAEKILAQDKFWNLPPKIVSIALQITNNREKAEEILEQDKFWNFHFDIVIKVLQITNNREKAEEILEQDKFWNFHFDIVIKALQITNNREKAEEILAQDKFWNFSHVLVCSALQITNNREKAEEILAQDKFWNFSHVLVCSALQITNNREKAEEILTNDKFWNFSHVLVCSALQITNNREKAEEILAQDKFWNFSHVLVCSALQITNNREKAEEILTNDKFWSFHHDVVKVALQITNNKEKAETILQNDKIWKFPPGIIILVLKLSMREDLIKKITRDLVAKKKWKDHWGVTYFILEYFSQKEIIPEEIGTICTKIILEYKDKNIKAPDKFFRFVNVMRLPLHCLKDWEEISLKNIQHWEHRARNLAACALLSYKLYPLKTKAMCKKILNNWERELEFPVQFLYRKDNLQYGTHIQLSLEHPNLQALALKIAKEIKIKEENMPGKIHCSLIESANKCIENNDNTF